MSKETVRILLAAVLFGLAVAALAAQNQATITETQGRLAGAVDAHGVRSFKDIPYAEPPVGDKRWTAPVAAAPWKGVRDAREFGASCVQPPYPADSIYADDVPKQSEDCLSLNVWTPPHAHEAPVIVWIFGGGLVRGRTQSRYTMAHISRSTASSSYRSITGSARWLAGVAGIERGVVARRIGQLRSARSNRSAQMGQEKHRRVRRRSRRRDDHG